MNTEAAQAAPEPVKKARKTLSVRQRLELNNAILAADAFLPDRILARDLSAKMGLELDSVQIGNARGALGLKRVSMPTVDELWVTVEQLRAELNRRS